jgi:hypothetical protein
MSIFLKFWSLLGEFLEFLEFLEIKMRGQRVFRLDLGLFSLLASLFYASFKSLVKKVRFIVS